MRVIFLFSFFKKKFSLLLNPPKMTVYTSHLNEYLYVCILYAFQHIHMYVQCPLTPLLDGLKRCLCFILFLVMAFGFFVSLEPLASLFALGAFFFILPRRLLVLVAAVLLLV